MKRPLNKNKQGQGAQAHAGGCPPSSLGLGTVTFRRQVARLASLWPGASAVSSLSLHDALPILALRSLPRAMRDNAAPAATVHDVIDGTRILNSEFSRHDQQRTEEDTSELKSQSKIV